MFSMGVASLPTMIRGVPSKQAEEDDAEGLIQGLQRRRQGATDDKEEKKTLSLTRLYQTKVNSEKNHINFV